jgi:hypothetical protein
MEVLTSITNNNDDYVIDMIAAKISRAIDNNEAKIPR